MGKITVQQMLIQLVGGMRTSIQIFLVTPIFSPPLGPLAAFGRISKNRLLQAIVEVYISIVRDTPLMLQLMVVYFGPYYLFRVRVGSGCRLWAVFIGFVTNYAAYFVEIYGSSTQSMLVGQYEAAQIPGYSRFQTFFKIILPQVIKRILPFATSKVITPVKDTSPASILNMAEMSPIVKALVMFQINMISFAAAGLFYYIFNLVVVAGIGWVEKRMDYYRQEQEDCGL